MVMAVMLQEKVTQDAVPAESSLIKNALAGDLSAFNHLVVNHQDAVYWWVYSLTKDEDLASDITQATFIKAYEKLADFRGGSFRAWLFTIARNRSFDQMRWQKRHPSLSIDEATDDQRARLDILPDAGPLPEDALISTEQAYLIEKVVGSLPDIFQQAVRLVDMEGMDYQEAADILGLPLGTIKSRLTRARLKVRSLLQEAALL